MNFGTLSSQRKFILIAAAAGLIAMFLPWVTVSAAGIFEGISEGGMSQNGMHGAGIGVFLFFLCAIIVIFLGDQTKTLEKTNWLVALAAGAAALLLAVIALAGTQTGDLGMVKSSMGYGAWIALLAAAGVLAFAWLLKNPNDTLKDSFDKLKNDLAAGNPSKNGPGGSEKTNTK